MIVDIEPLEAVFKAVAATGPPARAARPPADNNGETELEPNRPSRRAVLGSLTGAVAFPAVGLGRSAAADENRLPSPFGDGLSVGINLGGGEFGKVVPGVYAIDYIYPPVSDIEHFAAIGLRLIRIPFLWERLQRSLNGPLDAGEVAHLRELCAAASRVGAGVILDAHNYGRYYNDTIGSDAVPYAAFADFWYRMAVTFRQQPGVCGYDLCNEPREMPSPEAWPLAAQTAVTAIRRVDRKTTIIVEGDDYAQSMTWLDVNAELNIRDPADNIVYSAHCYFDRLNRGRYAESYDASGATPTIGAERLKPFTDWLSARKLRGYIGEVGCPADDPRWLIVLNNFLAACAAANLPVTGWAAGPWWGKEKLSLEPDGNADRPQIASFLNYPNP